MKWSEYFRTQAILFSVPAENSTGIAMTFQRARRTFLKTSLAAAGTFAAPNLVLAQGGDAVAETTNGRVQGRVENGLKVFRGIPYGGDTGGKNRFMPPTPTAKWAGARDASAWGHIAPKPVSTNPPNDYGRMVQWSDYRGGLSEDCLNLNVWTPGTDSAKRAVVVILHGGGFTSGSGNLVALEGDHLAPAGDVVVVTVNHRLGALGYTDVSALGGTDFAASGAVGMMDLVQSLQWVRDNIERFGGDPARVLITGQSGGGGKVSTLLAMPSARGLFHRAVLQSGSTIRLTAKAAAQRNSEQFLGKLNLTKADLAKLQALPFEQLMAAQAGGGPVVDGVIVPRNPFDPDAPAVSANVPMMIGSCLEDSGYQSTDYDISEAGVQAFAESQAAGKGAAIMAAYRKLYPNKKPYFIRGMIATDRNLRRNTVIQGERKAAQGAAPVYMYRFDWGTPAQGGRFGACHGVDLSISFANPDTNVGMNTPEAKALASRLGGATIAFAKTGNPDHPGIPHWAPYNAQTRSTMVFDAPQTRMENDPNRELRVMWNDILPA
jgi:para-nitrobenzyl esterase